MSIPPLPRPPEDRIDRFICRREGHKPSVKITKVSGVSFSTFTCKCLRCGQWIEVEAA